MDKVRVGILGTGIIVRDFHLPILQNHPRAEVLKIATDMMEDVEYISEVVEKTDISRNAGEAGSRSLLTEPMLSPSFFMGSASGSP